jgi:hypothetical protein
LHRRVQGTALPVLLLSGLALIMTGVARLFLSAITVGSATEISVGHGGASQLNSGSHTAPMKGQGRRSGGRVTWLAIGWLIVVLLAGCSTGGARPGASSSPTPFSNGPTPTPVSNGPSPSPHSNELTWAPPRCGGQGHRCVNLYLRNTGSHQEPSLDNNADYRIHLPANGPLVGGITINGGRNVLIIGGQIDLTYPCSNDANDCIGIYIAKNSPGAVFVEGVWIHNPARIGPTCPGGASDTSQTCSSGDGIDVNTTDDGTINVNTITLENIRIDGISGCSGYGDHSDVFQPYQAPDDTIRIDRMTGVTNCQGFTLDPDLAYAVWHTFPSSITVANANIDSTTNPYQGTPYGQKWWLTYGTTSCQSGPLFLINDYSSDPRGHGVPDIIWPDSADDICGSQYSDGAFSWPDTRIEGSIHIGNPRGGDFVPAGTVGLGYRSPGYR